MLSRRAVKEEEGGGFLLFFSYLFIKFLPFFFSWRWEVFHWWQQWDNGGAC